MENLLKDENWETLLKFLPTGWTEKAKELGALQRKRNIKSEADLLRILLMYLSNDKSLLATACHSSISGIAEISDVALLKRLKTSSLWFHWMTLELLKHRGIRYDTPTIFEKYNIISIDASVVSEPGSTGTDWRLHYALDMLSLNCNQLKVTRQSVGESFTNFIVKLNDLFMGDRAYGRYKSMKYVTDNGGFFITRFMNKAFTLKDENGCKINMINKVQNIRIGEIREFNAFVSSGNSDPLSVRFCILKMSQKEGDKAVKAAIKEQKKKQRKIDNETIELHRYIILMSSLPVDIKAEDILELYRMRWQIEIAFKRLKSIFGLGHLPKKDIVSGRAWLHGKIFYAILVQMIADESYLFSPWGYPIKKR